MERAVGGERQAPGAGGRRASGAVGRGGRGWRQGGGLARDSDSGPPQLQARAVVARDRQVRLCRIEQREWHCFSSRSEVLQAKSGRIFRRLKFDVGLVLLTLLFDLVHVLRRVGPRQTPTAKHTELKMSGRAPRVRPTFPHQMPSLVRATPRLVSIGPTSAESERARARAPRRCGCDLEVKADRYFVHGTCACDFSVFVRFRPLVSTPSPDCSPSAIGAREQLGILAHHGYLESSDLGPDRLRMRARIRRPLGGKGCDGEDSSSPAPPAAPLPNKRREQPPPPMYRPCCMARVRERSLRRAIEPSPHFQRGVVLMRWGRGLARGFVNTTAPEVPSDESLGDLDRAAQRMIGHRRLAVSSSTSLSASTPECGTSRRGRLSSDGGRRMGRGDLGMHCRCVASGAQRVSAWAGTGGGCSGDPRRMQGDCVAAPRIARRPQHARPPSRCFFLVLFMLS